MTRKEIAEWLDIAAARSEYVDRDAATRKQCWFLAGLMEQNDVSLKDLDLENTNAVLTKKLASFWIDQMLSKKQAA